MATWATFEAEAAEVAAFASRLWTGVIALARGDPVRSGAASFAMPYREHLTVFGKSLRTRHALPISAALSPDRCGAASIVERFCWRLARFYAC